MLACPKCGRRTKVAHSPRDSEGGLLRRHKCVSCGFQFETLQIKRGTVEAIVARRFKQQFGAVLDRFGVVVDRLERITNDLARH